MKKKSLKKQFIYFLNKNLSDSLAIKYKFKKHIGYTPNLKQPKTFNEKMQWLKLNDRSETHTIISDKFLARSYIAKIIDDKYLVPLLFQTYDVNELRKEILPQTPYVIKTNHDCGGMVFIRDKSDFNESKILPFFEKRLSTSYFYFSREWQYKNIKPCIIIERLLLTKEENFPFDYKVYCFNGKAQLISVDKDRGLKTKSRHWYDINWNKKDINWNVPSDLSEISKPKFLNEIIVLSEKLSKEFYFLRVDWYDVDGKLYIGELTLHPGGGILKIEPEKWDRTLGDMLELPIHKK